jgi:predicted dinucleotide-binding enzyme
MTTIGFIGSGNIGSTVARLAIAAGYDVIMSNSRGPETLADLVSDLGPQATAGTTADAAAADLVVVTIPLGRLASVPAAELAGRVVIDTMNYYPGRDGEIPELAAGDMTSSELVQQHLADSQVVKAFNNIFFQHLAALARPAGAADRSALPIAGNDEAAKRQVTEFLDRIGYDVADLGPLAESWRSQPDTPVYGTVYAADPANWGAGPSPAGVAAVTAAAAAATR